MSPSLALPRSAPRDWVDCGSLDLPPDLQTPFCAVWVTAPMCTHAKQPDSCSSLSFAPWTVVCSHRSAPAHTPVIQLPSSSQAGKVNPRGLRATTQVRRSSSGGAWPGCHRSSPGIAFQDRHFPAPALGTRCRAAAHTSGTLRAKSAFTPGLERRRRLWPGRTPAPAKNVGT